MNWIDIIALAATVFFAFTGWRAGLIQTFFRYLSLILGIGIAYYYNYWGQNFLKTLGVDYPQWQSVISFSSIFIIVFLLVLLVGFVLSRIVKPTPLGPIDRIAGALFGSAKALALLLAFAFVLSFVPEPFKEGKVWKNSLALNASEKILPLVKHMANKKLNGDVESQSLPDSPSFVDNNP